MNPHYITINNVLPTIYGMNQSTDFGNLELGQPTDSTMGATRIPSEVKSGGYRCAPQSGTCVSDNLYK